METKNLSITEMRQSIDVEVMKKKEVFNALAKNTFKGLDVVNIPQALLEGMMRGYSIKDFMTKKIYATPFWNGKERKQDYALVQSIADVRTIAMKSGQSGKSKPEYAEKDNKILSCAVTVWKKDGDERGYTAEVYFDEYEKPPYKTKDGKEIPGMWQTKPRTMIAKVAEMHALRMAFPEQLSDAYIEEEFDKENVVHIEPDADFIDIEVMENTMFEFEECKTVDELKKVFASLSPEMRKNLEIIELYKKRQKAITSESKSKK